MSGEERDTTTAEGAPPPSRVTLGTMTFGGRTPKAEALRLVARAMERGVVRVDTANLYESGRSESIVGEAIRGKREQVFLSTKVGAARGQGGAEGLSRERVLAACDESLARLGVECIDLYFLHLPDPKTPIEATLEAVVRLLEAGKIRAYGLSNFASWQALEVVHAARSMGLPGPSRAQMLYNVLVRQLDVEYFAFAARYGLPVEAYNPLAGGLLTPKHASPEADKRGSRFFKNGLYERRYWSEAFFARRDALSRLAGEHGVSLVHLAYGFLAARPGLAGVCIGPATLPQLDEAQDALATPLPAELLAEIEKLHLAWMGTDARYAR